VYKDKGDTLDCGSYQGIKMLEHILKLFEGIIGVQVREKATIYNMQFGFMGGKATTDAIFKVRQMQEKYVAKKKRTLDGIC